MLDLWSEVPLFARYWTKKTVGQTALKVLDDKGSLKQKAERKSEFIFTRYIDSNMAKGKHAITVVYVCAAHTNGSLELAAAPKDTALRKIYNIM